MTYSEALTVICNEANYSEINVIAAAKLVLRSQDAKEADIFQATSVMRRIRASRYEAEMASREVDLE